MTQLLPSVYQRDYSTLIAIPNGVTVACDSFSHAAMGGPKSADLTVTGPLQSLWSVLGWLRCPVEVYNERGEMLWWGFVNSAEVCTGGVTVGASLDEMANKIAVAYEEAGLTYGEVGIRETTAYAIDATGTATYGVKDLLYSMSSSTSALAEAQRDRLLDALGNPVATMALDGGDVKATLQCVGWWALLGWQHYSADIKSISQLAWPNYSHSIRVDADYYRLGQSFTVPEAWGTVYADWVDASLFQYGDAGSPDLTFRLLADGGGGTPNGGTLAACNVIAGTAITGGEQNFSYYKTAFTTKAAIVGGSVYHLVLDCDEPGSGSGYIAWRGMTGSDVYTGGVAYGLPSSGWTLTGPGADFAFAVNCAVETTKQISDIVTANANGMLLGCIITNASGIYTPPYRAGDTDGLREIEQMLDAGTSGGSRLLAKVRSDRYVEVYAEPAASTTGDVYVRPDGQLVSWRGQLLDKASLLPGQWCRLVLDDRAESELGLLGNVSPAFIDETEYIVSSDTIRIRTRDKTDPWDVGAVRMI